MGVTLNFPHPDVPHELQIGDGVPHYLDPLYPNSCAQLQSLVVWEQSGDAENREVVSTTVPQYGAVAVESNRDCGNRPCGIISVGSLDVEDPRTDTSEWKYAPTATEGPGYCDPCSMVTSPRLAVTFSGGCPKTIVVTLPHLVVKSGLSPKLE